MDKPDDERAWPGNTRSLHPGLAVAQYTIVDKIGAGGMGEVYLADDSRLRRQVALKFLPADCCDDREKTERFKREAWAAASLNHPNILTIHDIDEFQGRPFIVMEYFQGKTLKSLLRSGPLQIGQIIKIALQVADGLSCAHAAGVIHRDIKSENILIDSRGIVKIVDFGLARIGHSSDMTQTGTTLGTLAYMAPEQAEGKTADQRSDLFSFGVVLYELVTGKSPFSGEYVAAIINAILYEDPEPPTAVREDTPADLESLILRMLQKKPQDRYQSVDEIIDELQKHAAQFSIEFSPLQRASQALSLRSVSLIALAVIAVVTGIIIWGPFRGDEAPSKDRKRIVVLPFDNQGDSADEYFASGITEEITTHLTKMGGLGVISRSSAAQYKESTKSRKQIADELGVDYILDGSVRWDKSEASGRVRITAMLQNVRSNVSMWAETYDRVLDDIFAVQSDIAQKVSSAMNITLLESETRSLEKQPTDDIEAYTYYMQGLDYFHDGNWQLAEEMFSNAVSRDDSFAEAWAMLSRTHSLLYWWYIDRTDQRLQLAKFAADKALELDSMMADGYIALGRYYYRGHLDYDRAMAQYEKALRIQPNNSDLIFAIGSVKRRKGNWEGAVRDFQRAVSFDPRASVKLRNLAETYLYMRHYDSSMAITNRLIDITPDNLAAYGLKITILSVGMGRFAEADDVIENISSIRPRDELVDELVMLYSLSGRNDLALDVVNTARQTRYFTSDSAYWYLQFGDVCAWAGHRDRAAAAYDSARIILESYIKARPEEAAYHSMLGIAYAGLGRHADAIREGRTATELYPISTDALAGTSWRFNLMLIYAIVGENSLAAEEIKYLLSIPSQLTPTLLRHNPAFKEVRKMDEMRRLI